MKAQILKISGCKTQKEFYDKFPSEEAFMKVHGKEFKKAQLGIKIEKAQWGINSLPNIGEELKKQMSSAGVNQNIFNETHYNNAYNKGSNYGTHAPGNYNAWDIDNNDVPDTIQSAETTPIGQQNIPVKTNANKTGTEISGMEKAMPYVQAGMDVIDGIGMIKGQKNKLKEAKQMHKLSNLSLKAQNSIDVDADFSRKYLRPEDQVNTGEELFPIYGVGTNVLAKNGKKIQSEIQNTYGNEHSLYDDLEYEPIEEVEQFKDGGYMQYANMATNLSNRFINQGGQEDAGSKIGGGIGMAAGTVLGGPIGGAIGKFAGSTIGGLIDTSDRKLKRENEAISRNIQTMSSQAAFKGLNQQYNAYVENGGEIPQYRAGGHLTDDEYIPISENGMEQFNMGGELQTHWGGNTHPMSQNPYLPGDGITYMPHGQSHEESDNQGRTGIGITYGENPVEVERKEPMMKLKDGGTGEENLTVFGNLKIPNQYVDLLGDKNAKGKKFKGYVEDLSYQENKHNKLADKSSKEIENLEPITSFDKLKLSSLKSNLLGANMSLKEIADKKMKAAHLQNSINETAEEHGLEADALAKGKIKFAKADELAEFGKTISFARSGISTTTDETTIDPTTGRTIIKKSEVKDYEAKGYKLDPKNPNRYVAPGTTGGKGKRTVEIKGGQPSQGNKVDTNKKGSFTVEDIINNKGGVYKTFHKNMAGAPLEEIRKAAERLHGKEAIMPGKWIPSGTTQMKEEEYEIPASPEKEVFIEEDGVTPIAKEEQIVVQQPNKKTPWWVNPAANTLLNYLRPSDAEDFNSRQLLGEMNALSTNQLEPVKAQLYYPELDVPYDISLQDQLNEVTAGSRTAQKLMGYNPAAQANVAAQAYEQSNKVLGEQFRLNQAKKDQVYTGNRHILNDAQLKNLDILDNQYVRQEQAKSNTKAINQSALNSISDKYLQHNLENRKLQTMENMYNYRFGKDFKADNWNGLASFNTEVQGRRPQGMTPVYKSDGVTLDRWIMNDEDMKTVDEQGNPIVTNLATQKTVAEKTKSKTEKTTSRNGSILSMYKNL